MPWGALLVLFVCGPAAADEINDAKKPLDPARYPQVYRPEGEAFRLACSQCHVLPDPTRHTAGEWRAVVARMQENMEWMNRVVGSKPVQGEPQLRVEQINAFLE